MIVPDQDLFAVLRQYNPWWDTDRPAETPSWERVAVHELERWVLKPPSPRAVLLTGARQVGKTTLLLQLISRVLKQGTPARKILYATFDHPLLKLVGLQKVLSLWEEFFPRTNGNEYLFLDEIQYTADWQVWIKHQVDFQKHRRIVVTGSASPLISEKQESGVGRWHTIKLPTLSFFEYLQIKQIELPPVPTISSLIELFAWKAREFTRVGETARPLIGHFHEFLLRGGFPETAQIESIVTAQKLLREDIIEKVLKRDMTALYGVRRVLELEKTFLYLCLHDGGILDVPTLCSNLEVKRPTAMNFLDLLEAAQLIYKLPPYGLGKEVLRARYKVYLADPAIAGSVLLKGKALLEDATRLGAAVETSVFKHLYTRYYAASVTFSYWRGGRDYEVDLVADSKHGLVPFEIKYSQSSTGPAALKGLHRLLAERKLARGYVVTKDLKDFGKLEVERDGHKSSILKIPASLACYWLSQTERSSVEVSVGDI
jgi:uncharacterized protein